jgi:hypothetical protein
MSELSPAAQAVLDAAMASAIQNLHGTYERDIAAALRAAADQVIPLTSKPNDTFCIPPVATMVWMRETNIRKVLLAIAAELEDNG